MFRIFSRTAILACFLFLLTGLFAQESEVKTDPNLRSEVAFVLHEGTKVQILEFYEDNWTKVKLSDGKTGWIPSSDIKAL